jgi:G-patch domain
MSGFSLKEDDEDYFIPLEDQRVFGAGLKKKRVRFVRSTSESGGILVSTTTKESSSGADKPLLPSAAERYLSIVLPDEAKRPTSQSKTDGDRTAATTTTGLEGSSNTLSVLPSRAAEQSQQLHTPDDQLQLCEVCNFPIDSSSSTSIVSASHEGPLSTSVKVHEASIAHQVCLSHSNPPSHLDRTRHGLRYLAAYGWDPDSRLGLGTPGREGIREPLKQKIKNDTVGLGMKIEARIAKRKVVKEQKLNARQVRRRELEMKKKDDKLRELFYRSDNIQRHLGDI